MKKYKCESCGESPCYLQFEENPDNINIACQCPIDGTYANREEVKDNED